MDSCGTPVTRDVGGRGCTACCAPWSRLSCKGLHAQECGHMSSSFAASTCRTTLAPFRQGISPTPRLYAMTRRIRYSKIVGAVGFEPTNPSLVRRKQLTKRPSSQSRLHALKLRKPFPEMPRDAWESLHGGSRKWFPEQRPRPPQSGMEQRLPAPLPVTGTSALPGLKHQVRTGARPSIVIFGGKWR